MCKFYFKEYIHSITKKNRCTKKELPDCNEISYAETPATASNASDLPIQQIYMRSDSQSDGQNFFYISTANISIASSATMPHARILAHYKQMSDFKVGRLSGLKDAG